MEEACLDQPASEEHRVLARRRGRPDEPRAGGRLLERPQRRQRPPERIAVARREHRVRHRLVLRHPVAVELREAALVARQRAALAGRPPPGLVRLDLQMHHGVPHERLAHPLGPDRTAPERHHARVLPRQQLEDELLLACAERLLALAVEERLDGLAEPPLELAVRVERLGAELGGQRAGAGGLPGPHEAD
jgi:hypothetical protein